MKVDADANVDDLLKEHPFLADFLETLSPKFKAPGIRSMRKTVGKVATLGNPGCSSYTRRSPGAVPPIAAEPTA